MIWKRFFFLVALTVFLPLGHGVAVAGPYKGKFTGLFYGQGNGCWGALFIRTRTISWAPGDLTCNRTAYTIVEQSLHMPFEDYDHIVFKLHHLSNGCPFPYVGLYYYQPKVEAEATKANPYQGIFYDWTVVGFDSYRRYRRFPYRAFEDDDGSIYPLAFDILYCDLPYSGKPFPYGMPLD
ncbi:MAG: hypothetical protein KGK02_02180 [Rhodospirillales bacterium]|nr:hypothetical protein [Rhodospirillales bacterium]